MQPRDAHVSRAESESRDDTSQDRDNTPSTLTLTGGADDNVNLESLEEEHTHHQELDSDDGHGRGHEEHDASDSDDPPVRNTAPREKSAIEPADEEDTSDSPSVETLSEKTAQKSVNPPQGTGIQRAGQQTITDFVVGGASKTSAAISGDADVTLAEIKTMIEAINKKLDVKAHADTVNSTVPEAASDVKILKEVKGLSDILGTCFHFFPSSDGTDAIVRCKVCHTHAPTPSGLGTFAAGIAPCSTACSPCSPFRDGGVGGHIF